MGNDLHKPANWVTLKLHWQAPRRMEGLYTFYVHLVDVETGGLVAQISVIPHSWTYPTTWWEPEGVVNNEVTPHPVDVSSGPHRLDVRVGDGDSGERLRPTAPSTLAPGRYEVPTVIQVP